MYRKKVLVLIIFLVQNTVCLEFYTKRNIERVSVPMYRELVPLVNVNFFEFVRWRKKWH